MRGLSSRRVATHLQGCPSLSAPGAKKLTTWAWRHLLEWQNDCIRSAPSCRSKTKSDHASTTNTFGTSPWRPDQGTYKSHLSP